MTCFFRARRAPLSYPPIIPHRGMETRDYPSRSADADLLKVGTSVTSFRFEPPKAVPFFIPTTPTSPAQGGKVTSSDNRTSHDMLFSCSISSCPACSGIFSRHTRHARVSLHQLCLDSKITFATHRFGANITASHLISSITTSNLPSHAASQATYHCVAFSPSRTESNQSLFWYLNHEEIGHGNGPILGKSVPNPGSDRWFGHTNLS